MPASGWLHVGRWFFRESDISLIEMTKEGLEGEGEGRFALKVYLNIGAVVTMNEPESLSFLEHVRSTFQPADLGPASPTVARTRTVDDPPSVVVQPGSRRNRGG